MPTFATTRLYDSSGHQVGPDLLHLNPATIAKLDLGSNATSVTYRINNVDENIAEVVFEPARGLTAVSHSIEVGNPDGGTTYEHKIPANATKVVVHSRSSSLVVAAWTLKVTTKRKFAPPLTHTAP